MPRPMSAAMKVALSSAGLQPALFVHLTFEGPTDVYLWSGIGSIEWNGHTWTGVGSLLGVAIAEEGTTVEERGITISLSGLDPSLLAEALNDLQLGLPVDVYLGLFADGSLISDPVTTWAGRMDQPEIDVTGDSVTIDINCQSRFVDMNVAVDRRLTFQDSQLDNPGDLGLQFVQALQQQTLFWGNYPNSTNNI